MKKISFFGLKPDLTSKLARDGLRQNKHNWQRWLGSKAQVSLELIGGLIVCLVLIVGVARVFVWLNQCLVDRQYQYQRTRTAPRANIDNFYTPEDLSVFR